MTFDNRLLRFLYFKSEPFPESMDVRKHYQNLVKVLGSNEMNSNYKPVLNNKSLSVGGGFRIWYCFGHSEPGRGFQLSDGTFMNGKTFTRSFPENPLLRPNLVFFNTCDALGSGFVQAALAAGAFSVIYATEKILIRDMAQVGEVFFKNWARGGVTVQAALEKSRTELGGYPMNCIGIGSSMLFEALKKERGRLVGI